MTTITLESAAARHSADPVVSEERTCQPRGDSFASAGLRLTRRGQVAVSLLIAALLMLAAALIAAPASSSDSTYHASSTTIVVQPGQTLWEIAAQVAPDQDVRDVVVALTELNHLPAGGALRAGQPLVVPRF